MAQGAGSSLGATYDSQKGVLLLDRAVELTTQRGAVTIQIHAQHAEFERDSQLCHHLRAATAELCHHGGDSCNASHATANDATVLFRDRRIGGAAGCDERVYADDFYRRGHLAAPTGQMEFDEHNLPRHGRLMGGVTMDSSNEMEGRQRQLHGAAPTADIEFTSAGKLRHAHLERGVAMDSGRSQSAQAGQTQRLSRHWRSPVKPNVEFRDAGHGQIEPASMRGDGRRSGDGREPARHGGRGSVPAFRPMR